MDKRIIFGLLTLTVVGGVGYYLYRESKKTEGGTLRKGVDEVDAKVGTVPTLAAKVGTKQRVLEMQKQLAKTIDAKRDAQKEAPQVFIDDNPEGRLKR
jgi:hypothetical protein